MRLSYDGIEFQVLKIEEWTRTAVYDSLAGLDYLYSTNLITCVCILNQGYTDKSNFPDDLPPAQLVSGGINQIPPQNNRNWNGLAISGASNAVPQPVGNVPVFENGGLTDAPTGAAATLVELFSRLNKPRRTLRIWMNSNPNLALNQAKSQENILLSPLPGYTVDAAGGPTCNLIQPIPIAGNVTMALRLQFETHTPGCLEDDAPALLSNRWTFSVSAENDFAIHKIDGEARFRMDLLHERGMSADMFRKDFLHPIPVGFRREQPIVELLPSGDGVRYQLIDREMPLNFPGGTFYGCNKIEVTETRVYKSPIGVLSRILG